MEEVAAYANLGVPSPRKRDLTLNVGDTPADTPRRGAGPAPGSFDEFDGGRIFDECLSRFMVGFVRSARTGDPSHLIDATLPTDTDNPLLNGFDAFIRYGLNLSLTDLFGSSSIGPIALPFEAALPVAASLSQLTAFEASGPPPPRSRLRRKTYTFRVTGFTGQDTLPGLLGIVSTNFQFAERASTGYE